ncbi:Uncharacterized protein ABC855_g3446 [[Candida] zeylanoides]
MFKLSGTLSGHDQDVKAVAVVDASTVVTCSRDATARVWRRAAAGPWGAPAPATVFRAEGSQFLNAVAALPGGVVATGGIDGTVHLVELDAAAAAAAAPPPPPRLLVGHTKNVCSLRYGAGALVSSSWDHTAIVWDLERCAARFTLRGHTAAVWDAVVVDEERIATCSADGSIALWRQDKLVGRMDPSGPLGGHTGVVRKLAVISATRLASCSNDGSVLVWDLETRRAVQRFAGHGAAGAPEFVYDVAYLAASNELVTAGEDRSVRVWSLASGELVQAVVLPSVSVWCVAAFGGGDGDGGGAGDFVCGGSDNVARVFTRSARVDEAGAAALAAAVEAQAIPAQSVNLNRTDIPGYEALEQKRGAREGATLMVRSPQGVVEAHQWSANQWVKIGEVVDGAAGAKASYGGVDYDYVFDVDIEDGKPPLKLPFNLRDNPYAAAEKFLADNELPASYQDEVVQFIMQNTAGATLGGAEAPYEDPYADATARRHAAVAPAAAPSAPPSGFFPQRQYVLFTELKPTVLSRGLAKFNADAPQPQRLSAAELGQVDAALATGTIPSALALEVVLHIVPKIVAWPAELRLIGYDLLRVCVRSVTAADLLQSLDAARVVADAVASGVATVRQRPEDVALFMMLAKVLSNVVDTVLFQQLYFDAGADGAAVYSAQFAQLLRSLAEAAAAIGGAASHTKHYANAMLALATLVYNLSVYEARAGDGGVRAATVADFADSVGGVLVEAGSEAAYRITVAWGNLLTRHRRSGEEPEWLTTCRVLYVDSAPEERFVAVFKQMPR